LRQDRLKDALRSVEAGFEIGLGFLFYLLHYFCGVHVFLCLEKFKVQGWGKKPFRKFLAVAQAF
jgi:hypothetical protein